LIFPSLFLENLQKAYILLLFDGFAPGVRTGGGENNNEEEEKEEIKRPQSHRILKFVALISLSSFLALYREGHGAGAWTNGLISDLRNNYGTAGCMAVGILPSNGGG